VFDNLRHRFELQKVAVLHIYFDYKDRQNQSDVRILSSLLKQLVSQLKIIPSSLAALHDVSIATNTKPGRLTLLGHFIACVGQFESVYILLDAIDECVDREQDQILSLLNDLLSESTLKIMITSRPHLTNRIYTLSASILGISINPTDIDDDVQTYLISRLREERFLRQDLKNRIVQEISKQAEGM
jgi:hypothetical protein